MVNIKATLDELKDILNIIKTKQDANTAWTSTEKTDIEKRIAHCYDKSNPRHTNLTQDLELKITEVELTTQELDDSLIARFKANQSFDKVFEKLQNIKKELENTEEEASQEIIDQDQKIDQLRNQRSQFKLKVQQLERELRNAKNLAEINNSPTLPRRSYSDEYDALAPARYFMYSLSLLMFLLMIWGNYKKIQAERNTSAFAEDRENK